MNTIDGIIQESSVNFVGKDGFFWWVGEVEDNEDPMELGRVKVRVLGYYTNFRGGTTGDLPTEHLPWASVLQHTSQAGNDGQGESSGQLQPGAIVMGFFMDGENAQMPIVMGVLRVEKSDDTNEKKQFAFTGEDMEPGIAPNPASLNPMYPNATTASSKDEGYKRQGPTNTVKMPSMRTSDTGGLGSPSNLGVALPGSSGNANKPTDVLTPSAKGVGGPIKSFKQQLKNEMQNIADTASTLIPAGSSGYQGGGSEAYYINVTNGKMVTGPELTAPIQRILAPLFTQLIAAQREAMGNLAEELDKKKLDEKVTGEPLVIYQAVQDAITQVLSALCKNDSQLASFIADPMSSVTDNINSFLEGKLDKSSFIEQSLDDITESIVCSSESIVGQIQGVIGSIESTLQGQGEASKILDEWKEGEGIISELTSIFENADSALDVIGGILAMFLKFAKPNCERKPDSAGDDSGWYPFFGVTNCSEEELEEINKMRGSDRSKCGSGDKPNSLIDSMLKDVDPYLTSATTNPSGGYTMHSGTPGAEMEVNRTASGTTSYSIKRDNAEFAKHVAQKEYRKKGKSKSSDREEAAKQSKEIDSYVNKQTGGKGSTGALVADHTSYAGNLTQEVHGDECKSIDKDFDYTVKGDYKLKVDGDFHLTVGGGFFVTATGAPKMVDRKGNKKNEKIQKHTINLNTDLDIKTGGAKLSVHGTEFEVASTDVKMTGSNWSTDYDKTNIAGGDVILVGSNSITLQCPSLFENINYPKNEEKTYKQTGIYRQVTGNVQTDLFPDGSPVATPPKYTIVNEEGPYNVTCADVGASIIANEGSIVIEATEGALSTKSGENTTIESDAVITISAEDEVIITGSSIYLN